MWNNIIGATLTSSSIQTDFQWKMGDWWHLAAFNSTTNLKLDLKFNEMELKFLGWTWKKTAYDDVCRPLSTPLAHLTLTDVNWSPLLAGSGRCVKAPEKEINLNNFFANVFHWPTGFCYHPSAGSVWSGGQCHLASTFCIRVDAVTSRIFRLGFSDWTCRSLNCRLLFKVFKVQNSVQYA